jgi:hypothetical protein
MPQLAERLGLDLADALACHIKVMAHFFQRMRRVHANPETFA